VISVNEYPMVVVQTGWCSRGFVGHGEAGNSWSTAPRLRNGIALQGNTPFTRLRNGIALQGDTPARRDECRVAGHTNEEQRGSAPVCAAKMGDSFTEIT